MDNKFDKYDIEDDEIFILGDKGSWYKRIPWWVWLVGGVVITAMVMLLLLKPNNDSHKITRIEDYYVAETDTHTDDIWVDNVSSKLPSCTVVSDTTIDSIKLKIYTPYNAVPELYIGHPDQNDSSIVFATLAADIRGDNGKIVGAYVYEGEPLSWGLSKKGYCAIIDGCITLGVAENSPLFEQAIEDGGYFFRQYAAVDNGIIVRNNPKNAAFRRALCMLNGKVCIVASSDRVLMNTFSEALVELGVQNAIFLVGTAAAGWYRDEVGAFSMLGTLSMKNAKYINYIVFRSK